MVAVYLIRYGGNLEIGILSPYFHRIKSFPVRAVKYTWSALDLREIDFSMFGDMIYPAIYQSGSKISSTAKLPN